MIDPRIAIIRSALHGLLKSELADKVYAELLAEIYAKLGTDDISTEIAADCLHELGDDDFANVIGALLKRRHPGFPDRATLLEEIAARAGISIVGEDGVRP